MAKQNDQPKPNDNQHVTENLDVDPNDPRNREYGDGAAHSLNDPEMGGLGTDEKTGKPKDA